MANRLINETSPYLLQHAHNPVDWYGWGEEAFEAARRDNKPLLVSIGYSSCHWCHVMERESYEDDSIAELMNQLFVNVKIDREERPDLDGIFMNAVQMLSGQGGWPLNVFLTPDGKPFFGGTYFPPEDRQGMPGWSRVLRSVSDAYVSRHDEVLSAADQVVEKLNTMFANFAGSASSLEEALEAAFGKFTDEFDQEFGGFGLAPKFPQPMNFEFLLRRYARIKDENALQMVEKSLLEMARGGIYDHVGGGFHRYSTDPRWLVPHFEKMLYDNALLARVYLHTYQVTKTHLYREVVEQTLDYVLRDMCSAEGAFYSAQDADSEGVEGKFYVWAQDEIASLLTEQDAAIAGRFFGVSSGGNFEGANILYASEDLETVASEFNITVDDLTEKLRNIRTILWAARAQKVAPETDDKILISWNSMMVRTFAEAGAVLDRADYRQAAIKCASFMLATMRDEGRLRRTFRAGRAHLNAYLEDYALLADALLAVYEITFDPRWLEEAQTITRLMIDYFLVVPENLFYDTSHDHEKLIVRPRDVFDNAVPSGSAAAADVLLKISDLTGDEELRTIASENLQSVGELMVRSPQAAGQWLCTLEFFLSTPKEIVVIGMQSNKETRAFMREIYDDYRPTTLVVGAEPETLAKVAHLPLFEGREMVDGVATVYVCENYTCMMPVTSSTDLAEQLGDNNSTGTPFGFTNPFA